MSRQSQLPPLLSARDRPLAPGTEVELALLDAQGVIVAVNDAWLAFCAANGGDCARTGGGDVLP